MQPVDRLIAPAADAMHANERISGFIFAIVTLKQAIVFRIFAENNGIGLWRRRGESCIKTVSFLGSLLFNLSAKRKQLDQLLSARALSFPASLVG